MAIVGQTGSGKSTIAHLTTGLLIPWSGVIYYDDLPIMELGRQRLCEKIAVVNQEIFLFAGSFYENITLWDESIPIPVVREACRDAGIHDEIVSRAGGYHSQIIEGGRNLSEGQRQRLEIARALVRSPGLLILDEATSALDVDTEAKVFNNIFSKKMSCMVITHRMSAIKHCDRVLVFDQGQLVQEGHPQVLESQEGPFSVLLANERS